MAMSPLTPEEIVNIRDNFGKEYPETLPPRRRDLLMITAGAAAQLAKQDPCPECCEALRAVYRWYYQGGEGDYNLIRRQIERVLATCQGTGKDQPDRSLTTSREKKK